MSRETPEWRYAVTPGYLVRFMDGYYEFRHLRSGEWMPFDEPDIQRQVTQDGTPINEEQVEQVFESLRKKLLKTST